VSWPVGRVLCTRLRGPAAIHLGLPLPAASSGLPASSGGPPSIARAGAAPVRRCSLLTLLRVGFTEPPRSPWALVVSYTTVSPLPPSPGAVCFLWHCPAGHPGSALPTTLPCGARTFLGAPGSPGATRPPGQLTRRCLSAYGPAGARPSTREGGRRRPGRRRPPISEPSACSSVNQAAQQAAVLAVTARLLRRGQRQR
jgi:hypothetical protein